MTWKLDNAHTWTYIQPREQPEYKKYTFEYKITNTLKQTQSALSTHSNPRMKIAYLLNPTS